MSMTDDYQRELRRAQLARWYARHGAAKNAAFRNRRKQDPGFGAKLRDYGLRYLDRHGDEVNAKRRHRLATDAEYKARVDRAHADWRQRVRDGHVPRWPPLHLTIKGRQVRVYRQSEASRLIGCSMPRITRWIKDGWLPEANHWHRGRRVFTRHQLDLIGWFHGQNCHDHDARSRVSKIIFKIWKKELRADDVGGFNLIEGNHD